MLTVHHLRVSQSERIVWLCEELGLDYVLKTYSRDPQTMLAPPEYKALHAVETSPVIDDDGLVLAESGAIVEYLIARHGRGRLARGPADPDFADYLFWLHFANASLMASESFTMLSTFAPPGMPLDHPLLKVYRDRTDRGYALLERRLGTSEHLAGAEFSAADIMVVFALTTMRAFTRRSLADFPHIRAYLARIGQRPAYRRAMAKGDPDMAPMLS